MSPPAHPGVSLRRPGHEIRRFPIGSTAIQHIPLVPPPMNAVLTRLLGFLSILFLAVAAQAQGIGQERNLTLVPWLMRVVDPTGAELGSATLRITRQAPNADGFEIFGNVAWDLIGAGSGLEFVSGTLGASGSLVLRGYRVEVPTQMEIHDLVAQLSPEGGALVSGSLSGAKGTIASWTARPNLEVRIRKPSSQELEISWPADPGSFYQLQQSSDPKSQTWNAVTLDWRRGDSGRLTVPIALDAAKPMAFYRVAVTNDGNPLVGVLDTKMTVFNKTNRRILVDMNDISGLLAAQILPPWSGKPEDPIPQAAVQNWSRFTPSDVRGLIDFDPVITPVAVLLSTNNDNLTFDAGNPTINSPWIQFVGHETIHFYVNESHDVTYTVTLKDGSRVDHRMTLRRGGDTDTAKDMQIFLNDLFPDPVARLDTKFTVINRTAAPVEVHLNDLTGLNGVKLTAWDGISETPPQTHAQARGVLGPDISGEIRFKDPGSVIVESFGTNGDKFTFNSGPNGDGTIWVQLQGQEKVSLSLPASDGSPTTGSSVTVDYPIVKTDGTTASHRFVIARGANLPDATDIRLTIIR